jgi:protein tyrosine phosphatase (PTP) superfamily phosphohydrolase (DUF442 family)
MNPTIQQAHSIEPPKVNKAVVLLSLIFLLGVAVPVLGPSKSSPTAGPSAHTAATSVVLTAPSTTFGKVAIKIKNFGQMDERFYRGAQPRPEDYRDLAAIGVKTVVDLRDDPTSYEKREAEAAGMHYVNIPMSDKKKPTNEQIAAFFTVANDENTWPFYVHCAGGRHRTGLIGAVYRFSKYGWDYDNVYKEMKNYDYYSRWGHGAIKDYVQEYYEAMKSKLAKASEEAAAPVEPQAEPTQPATVPPPPKPKE